MKFLRVAMCAAAVGFASAAREQLTLPVSAKALQPLAEAHAAAHGVDLQQFRPVRPDDIVRVPISENTPGLSQECHDSLLLLQNDATAGGALDVVLTDVAQMCVQLVTREALEDNQDALITTVACNVSQALDALNEACGEVDGAVADFTVTQDITREDRANFFVRLSVDYYQCVPFGSNGCSVADVEAVGVALASGLANIFFEEQQEFINDVDNNLNGLGDGVVDVNYAVTAFVFGAGPDFTPQGIFGGAEAFLTSTTITGASRSQPPPASPLALFVRSDDNNFADVEVLSPPLSVATDLCKNMAASLNIDTGFRQARCVADCQERVLPTAQLNIWCPVSGQILIREGSRGLPPEGVAQPISGFDADNTGFEFSGSPAQSVQVPQVPTNAGAMIPIGQATLPNGNPILAPGVGLPIPTLPGGVANADNASSFLQPTALTTVACLVLAAVSRHFC